MGCLCGECHVKSLLGTGSEFLVLFQLDNHDIRTFFVVEDCPFYVRVALVIELLDDVLILEGVSEGGEHGVNFFVEGGDHFL